MNRRQKIIVSVTGIFLVMLILVGLTYAYFLTQIQGNEEDKSITVTTANLILEYGDGNGIIEIDRLEPSNNFITFRDKNGNEVSSKIFTVTNKGNATVEGYKVYLENVQNQLERKDDLVYTLSCKAYSNYGETNQTELETGCNGVSSETTFPDVITSIVTNDIAVGVTHVYELKLKYKEMNVDQSVDMNKLITAKVNIYGGETKFLASEIINNAKVADATTPLVEYSQLGITENTTIPLKVASLAEEHILSSTQDYYGTSYFYRGSVQNNYVIFNDLCWRIVRIEGDGSVKLVLAGTPTNNTCENLPPTNGGLLNKEDGALNVVVYGYKTVGEKILADYKNNEQGKIDGKVGLYEVLTEWYNANFDTVEKQKNVKQNTLWCLGEKENIGYSSTGELIDVSTVTTYYYSAGKRYFITQTPSLMCGSDEDKIFDVIGTLTLDEFSLAGNGYNVVNTKHYLQHQAKTYYWALSQGIYNNNLESVFYVTSTGRMEQKDVNTTVGVRPSLSLVTNVKITEGDGTNKTPYIIEN